MPNLREPAAARSATPPAGEAVTRVVAKVVAWTQRAATLERAEAASALARAWLHADLSAALRAACAEALAALAGDPEIEVRRALAEAFAGARGAPRALVLALAGDRSEVALPLLARSPVLTDFDLVDCVAAGDATAQCAVARRAGLGAGPAAALAEVGGREAALALVGNSGAALERAALRRLVERFGGDAEVREALLVRPGLPACVGAEIVMGSDGPGEGARLRDRDLRDAALAALAARCPRDELPELARTLHERGALTLALLLRSLLGGERALFAAALAELSGLPASRAAALLDDPGGRAFAAAAARAGLPAHALPVLRAVLTRQAAGKAGMRRGLQPDLLAASIIACEAEDDPALAPSLAFLGRLAAETSTAGARPRTLPRGLAFRPANDDPTAGSSAVAALVAALSDSEDPAPPTQLPADWILALDAA